mmetsp:Transcript_89948/g.259339  ORF Transcript_89948/g.259339 Transcript_89948/m.259339 type:complete len:367 (+) Transcript_89948:2887-3987(+)
MRVGQLRLQVKLEFGIVVDFLAADLDDHGGAPALDDRARKDGLEDRVDFLAYRLDEQLAAHLDGVDHLLEPIVHRELEDVQVFAQPLLNPLYALQLRVDHQRPSRTTRDHRCVLQRNAVGGQALVLPARLVRLAAEHGEGIDAGSDGDRFRVDVRGPSLLPQLDAELHRERRDVTNKGRGQQAIADEFHAQVLQILDGLGPSLVLVREAVHQTLGERQLFEASSGLRLHALLLGDSGLELRIELCTLLLDLCYLRFHDREGSLRLLLFLCRLRDLLHQGRNLHIDLMELDDVDRPIRQIGSCEALALHGFIIKEGEGEKRIDLFEDLVWDLFALEGKYRLQERIRVLHHALGRLPIDLLLAVEQQV